MGIIKDNITRDYTGTTGEAIARIKGMTATWFSTSELFSECDTYINDKATLEDNLIGEAILTGKRGGSNRLRVYVNRRNGLLGVSVRYGNNIAYHDEVVTASGNFTKQLQIVASDGKTESRIQFMATRFNEWLKLVNDTIGSNDIKKADATGSATA